MRAHHLNLGRVVGEQRPNLLALELLVFVPAMCDGRAEPVERSIQSIGARPERQRIPSGRQLQRAAFNNGNTVFGVVVSPAAAGVAAFAGPSNANRRKAVPRVRIGYFPFRRIEVARAAAATSEIEGELAVTDLDVAGAARLFSCGSKIRCEISRRALNTSRRNFVGDDVDEPPNRVGAVHQRGRPANDFDRLRRRRVQTDTVIP